MASAGAGLRRSAGRARAVRGAASIGTRDLMVDELMALFPLNTVLFPGMPLPLHIFEERYKLMIGRCLEEERPFGVVLIQSGPEVGGTAVPHRVGTTAHIAAVRRLDDGRMNLIAIGQERF